MGGGVDTISLETELNWQVFVRWSTQLPVEKDDLYAGVFAFPSCSSKAFLPQRHVW